MEPVNNAAVDASAAADALRRVLASGAFVRSPQTQRLLEYLVVCALANKSHLKAYTVAVEGLGRPDDFDPEQDSTVRVQATRLRKALDDYYNSDGKNDGVRIRLPAGGYNIVFERREIAAALPLTPVPARRRAPLLAGMAAVVIAAASLLMAVFGGSSIFGSVISRLAGGPTDGPLRGNGLPTIVIQPFDFVGPPERFGLRRFITDAFSQFEGVNTVYRPRSDPPMRGLDTIDAASRYDLKTLVLPDGDQTLLKFQLLDHADGSVIWSRNVLTPANRGEPVTQKKIVRTLASTLLQPYGIIASRERAKHLRTNKGDQRYRCILQAVEALRRATEADYADARTCLEETIKLDSRYSLAYAYLSSIHNRYFQYALDSDPTWQPSLDKALWAARMAVETNPASARAQFALYNTLFNLRDFNAATAAITKARTLNEHNMLLLAEYGGRLIAQGKVDDGMAILAEIDDAFMNRTCTHEFYLFLGHFLRNDWPEAAHHASQLTCATFPYSYIAKALVAAKVGDVEVAKQQIEQLRKLSSVWRTEPSKALARMFPESGIVVRILGDLATVGLITSAENQSAEQTGLPPIRP